MPKLKQSDYETLAIFRYSLRQFLRFSEEAALSIGLTPQQHQALLTIRGFPDRKQITIGELAEWLQIKHHSTVELVNRLEEDGLVTREASEQDHRQVFIVLTEHGANILERLSAAHKQELLRIGPRLNMLIETLSAEEES